MVDESYDAVIVGAGGDGPVIAWKLGRAGLDVLVLEAGPFHGNEKWPNPHEAPGAEATSDPSDLSGELLDEQFTTRELEMAKKLLFGPADHERGLWPRKFPGSGITLQAAGVGGTTLMYTSNHPRAYPAAIDEQPHWPDSITYEDLLPYYREVESVLGVSPAPVTAKEELFFRGAEAAGYDLLDEHNITEPGYRPQPNAIASPDSKLREDGEYDGNFKHPDAPDAEDPIEGHTMVAHEIPGNPHPRGAPFEEKAKKSSAIGFVPRALSTGNVTIRPNAFVTEVLADRSPGSIEATGVEFRDTWSGNTERVSADVIVLAAGAVETPRLWLNSNLPDNGWVGKGMTIHFGDNVMGFFQEEALEASVGKPTIDPHAGEVAARIEHPGLGMLQPTRVGPGMNTILGFGASASGFTFNNDVSEAPWDSQGRLTGTDLKRFAARYRQSIPVLVITDDRPHQRNGISVAPGVEDEHGPIPQVNYIPSEGDIKRRDHLAEIATEILREAGADHIHRSDSPPTALHIHSTMAMGKVIDTGCEAYDIDRVFVGDHSALANGLGGPNPTNTGQALAARTAEMILSRYF